MPGLDMNREFASSALQNLKFLENELFIFETFFEILRLLGDTWAPLTFKVANQL